MPLTARKTPARNSPPARNPRAEVAAQAVTERPAPTLIKPGNSGKALIRPEYREFARKLREAMHTRQMSASDVARAVWGTVPDPRGYEVAKNRDRIGAYLAGAGYPSKETLPKLCEAVGLSPDDLPAASRSTAAREFSGTADLTFSLLPDHPEICSLYIRRLLPVDVGLKIVELVNNAKIDDPA